MVRNMNWKSWVILGLAVTVLVTSGSLVMASNMGFKINKAIQNGFVAAQAPKAQNWISLPYSNPYPKAKDLCTALGSVTNAGTVTQIDPATGTPSNFLCGGAATAASNFTLTNTRGVRFSQAGAVVNTGLLVGSSDETKQLTVLDAFVGSQAPKKDNWISVPYHTTWVKAHDICITLNILTNAVTISRIDPVTGTPTSHQCGQGAAGAGNFSLIMGESVRVRRAGAGVVNFFPPHF